MDDLLQHWYDHIKYYDDSRLLERDYVLELLEELINMENQHEETPQSFGQFRTRR